MPLHGTEARIRIADQGDGRSEVVLARQIEGGRDDILALKQAGVVKCGNVGQAILNGDQAQGDRARDAGNGARARPLKRPARVEG